MIPSHRPYLARNLSGVCCVISLPVQLGGLSTAPYWFSSADIVCGVTCWDSSTRSQPYRSPAHAPRRRWARSARWMQPAPTARRSTCADPKALASNSRRRAGEKPGVWQVSSTNRGPGAVNSAHKASNARQVLGQSPCLAMRAVTVTGRIENHRIIAVAAADLALHEFHGVFSDPANGRLAQSRRVRRCVSPRQQCFGPHRRASPRPRLPRQRACCRRCRQTSLRTFIGARRIGRASPDLLRNPVPVLGLLGKKADVTEIGPLQLEGHAAMGDGPVPGWIAVQGPLAPFVIKPLEPGIGRGPKLGETAGRIDSAAGHGRSSTSGPKRSSRRPSPKSRS